MIGKQISRNVLVIAIVHLLLVFFCAQAHAEQKADYKLNPGDVVRISVFQSPDMQVDSAVSNGGSITYPLVGNVDVAGLTVAAAEQKLIGSMKQGGFDIGSQQLSMTLIKIHDGKEASVADKSASAVGEKTAESKTADNKVEYRLGAGDSIRIMVFQNPDLSVESRISDSGTITYPLIGAVELSGLSISAAEHKLGAMLKDGGFVVDPQLSITLLQVRGNQVSVLGQVSRPGRYPLEQANMKVTDILALAGGIVPGAADNIVLVGMRDGKLMRRNIDVVAMLLSGSKGDDIAVENGDIFYINRAPVFYIHGEVQRPGSYRVERDMTLMQALAQGGGISLRGTERSMKVYRRNEKTGKVEQIELDMLDPIQADDVIYVRESWF